ncbi:MAG: hypothetical protein KAH33_01150 [Candidatus Delongbacteria bacterium]|nr:hypothetical protein [Candidatus Delongbacteria bacterium]
MKRFIVAIMLLVSIVLAEKSDVLKKGLVDLKGWEAEEAEGMSMNMGGMKMTNAMREYTKGDQEFYVTIMVGTNTMTQGQMPQTDFETETGKMHVKEIKGFKVYQMFDKKEKTGAIVIYMEKNETEGGFMMFSFQNMTPEKAFELSEDFDWKKINNTIEGLLKK